MKIASAQTMDFIADHSKGLAAMADDFGQEPLAYLLRMAELEARNVGMAKESEVKTAAMPKMMPQAKRHAHTKHAISAKLFATG